MNKQPVSDEKGGVPAAPKEDDEEDERHRARREEPPAFRGAGEGTVGASPPAAAAFGNGDDRDRGEVGVAQTLGDTKVSANNASRRSATMEDLFGADDDDEEDDIRNEGDGDSVDVDVSGGRRNDAEVPRDSASAMPESGEGFARRGTRHHRDTVLFEDSDSSGGEAEGKGASEAPGSGVGKGVLGPIHRGKGSKECGEDLCDTSASEDEAVEVIPSKEAGSSRDCRARDRRSAREFFESRRLPDETLLHTIARRQHTQFDCQDIFSPRYGPTSFVSDEMAAHPDHLLAADARGCLPIHVAATWDHDAMLPHLVECGTAAAGLDVRTQWGRDLPLHLACRSGAPPDVLRKMVLKYPPSLRYENASGKLPLEILASHHPNVEAETFELFVAFYPASIKLTTKSRKNLLHCVLERGPNANNADFIRSIVVKFPDLAQMKDARSQFPLHYCAFRIFCEDVIDAVMAAHPAAAREVDADGNLPLHLAGDAVAVRLLCRMYPNGVHARNRRCELPLHTALGLHRSGAALALLEAWGGAAPVVGGESRVAGLPLHQALRGSCSGRGDLIRALVRRFPEALRRSDAQGRLPLHVCAESWVDGDDDTFSILEHLVQEYPDAALEFDGDDYLPLSSLIVQSRWRCERGARFLVEAAPEALRLVDKEGRLVLHCIVDKLKCYDMYDDRIKVVGLIRLLANAYPDSLVHQDKRECTPLHVVASRAPSCHCDEQGDDEQVDIMRAVLSEMVGPRPDVLQVKNGEGHAPIHVFLRRLFSNQTLVDTGQVVEVVKVLFYDGCCDRFSSPNSNTCQNVLQAAVDSSYARSPLLTYLVKQGCPHLLKVPDEVGMLPLHRFLRSGDTWEEGDANFIGVMIGIHPEGVLHQDRDGDTPLHVAALEDAPAEVIDCLVAASLESLHTRNSSGQTPFDIAACFFEQGRRTDTIAALIRGSSRVLDVQDSTGKTPFHRAVATWKGDSSQILALKMMLDARPRIAAIPDRYGMWPALSAAANASVRNSMDTSSGRTRRRRDGKIPAAHGLRSPPQYISDSTDSDYSVGGGIPADHTLPQDNRTWLGIVFDLLKESPVLFEEYVANLPNCAKTSKYAGRKRPHPELEA